MIKIIIKTAAIGCLCVPMLVLNPSLKVHAETTSYNDMENPVAGIAVALNNYYANAEHPEEDLKAYLGPVNTETVSSPKEKKASPYEDVAISRVSNYVNVRDAANTEAEIVGKIYNNCAATILETIDGEEGEWYHIKSGSVTGYIKAEYFITGEEAEQIAKEVGTVVATVVNTATLRLREEPSMDATTLTLLAEDSEYIVISEEDEEFVKIAVDNDLEGYAAKEYLDIRVDFEKAISIEEEQAQKEEEERLKKEAEEAMLKAEEARKAASKPKQAAPKPKPAAPSGGGSSTPAPTQAPAPAPPAVSSEAASATRDAIVAYAKQFLGNPYSYGGSSLTNGTDCSGFTSSIYKAFGISIGRSSRDQAANGREIGVENVQPGDLIFYASGGRINHVAMSIGGGQVIHASTAKTGIIISNMYYRTPCKAVTFLD